MFSSVFPSSMPVYLAVRFLPLFSRVHDLNAPSPTAPFAPSLSQNRWSPSFARSESLQRKTFRETDEAVGDSEIHGLPPIDQFNHVLQTFPPGGMDADQRANFLSTGGCFKSLEEVECLPDFSRPSSASETLKQLRRTLLVFSSLTGSAGTWTLPASRGVLGYPVASSTVVRT